MICTGEFCAQSPATLSRVQSIQSNCFFEFIFVCLNDNGLKREQENLVLFDYLFHNRAALRLHPKPVGSGGQRFQVEATLPF